MHLRVFSRGACCSPLTSASPSAPLCMQTRLPVSMLLDLLDRVIDGVQEDSQCGAPMLRARTHMSLAVIDARLSSSPSLWLSSLFPGPDASTIFTTSTRYYWHSRLAFPIVETTLPSLSATTRLVASLAINKHTHNGLYAASLF